MARRQKTRSLEEEPGRCGQPEEEEEEQDEEEEEQEEEEDKVEKGEE